MGLDARAVRTRRWVVDPAHSTVELRVKHPWGLSTVTGRFERFDGAYTVGADGATIELDVDAASLDTGNEWRDRRLRDLAFFQLGQHRRVRFASTDVRELGGGKLWVDGELEAAGRTIPVSFGASRRDVGAELELEMTTPVDQRLLGMAYTALGVLRAPASAHVSVRLKPA